MSNNTPKHLETPILGSKIKGYSRQVSASGWGWLAGVSATMMLCRQPHSETKQTGEKPALTVQRAKNTRATEV